jgi:hypothetical protein
MMSDGLASGGCQQEPLIAEGLSQKGPFLRQIPPQVPFRFLESNYLLFPSYVLMPYCHQPLD